jgi:MFS family permease
MKRTGLLRKRTAAPKIPHPLGGRTTHGVGLGALLQALRDRFASRPDDLLRDAVYRRLWTSILISSFGGQVTMLALPLTAAVLLQATPTQMGLLTAMEMLPFALLSLPSGVWLDRVRKLPVYVLGEVVIAIAVASVPLAWWAGWLSMPWLYAVGFLIGCVYTVAGSAAQIVLTQVVARDRLVEAHAKNALASSGAEVAGPGLAGLLIKLVGAPLALLADAVLVLFSAAILRGVRVHERRDAAMRRHFWQDLKTGLRFVISQRLLLTLAVLVGLWQMSHHAAMVVQILFATRQLGLSEQGVGLCYVGLGVGTVLASVLGHRISEHLGPGRALTAGLAITALGWLLLAAAPLSAWGVAAFAGMLVMFGFGAVLVFITFLSLRQAVTPEPLLGRMTSTMRWMTVLPAGPGALLGGWLGEHVSLRASLAFAGCLALGAALLATRLAVIRDLKRLPEAEDSRAWLGGEATVAPTAS